MRPHRRFPLSHCAIIFLLLAVFPGAALAQSSSPSDQQTQSAQTAPATQIQLPTKWNDAVRALAGKIASTAGSSRRISLELKNISSLDSSAATRIRQALDSELALKGLKPGVGGVTVHVTLSEGIEGYIWVAEYVAAEGRQLVLVAAPKEAVASLDHAKESLSLDKRLVWSQPGKFFDFSLFVRPVGQYSTLVILGPDRLAYYRSSDDDWQFWKSVPIPHPAPWPRNVRGRINNSSGIEIPWLPGVQCSGELEDPDQVQCGPLKRKFIITAGRINVPGHRDDEIAGLLNRCGADSVVLASGTGDWTQPDTIQGYLLPEVQAHAVPSGTPLELDGPVMDLHAAGSGLADNAIVLNLKSGKYEGYIVTATCNH
jgi:hypothetical protein